MARLNLIKLADTIASQQPEELFLMELQKAISASEPRQKVSGVYRASSLNCLRQMYFRRTGAPTDELDRDYQIISMADTGTRRHEGIQFALGCMDGDWEYYDVDTYIYNMQLEGKLLSISIDYDNSTAFETRLINSTKHLYFMCDGILLHKPTNQFYLFEFKNQISYKFNRLTNIDPEHLRQVTCYCAELGLDKAIVVYENRDTCELKGYLVHITEDDVNKFNTLIQVCEAHVEDGTKPDVPDDKKPCRWCEYHTVCNKVEVKNESNI